jgi:plasmid stabilization system protein ParE
MRKRMTREWSAYAWADRDAIFNYIEADSPPAAITVDNRIREQIETLLRFPQIGRPGRIQGTRELVISRTPYVVPISSRGTLSESCACFTARGAGPTIYPKELPGRTESAILD